MTASPVDYFTLLGIVAGAAFLLPLALAGLFRLVARRARRLDHFGSRLDD